MRHFASPRRWKTGIDKVNVPSGKRGDWTVEKFEITEAEARLSNLRAAINGRPRESVDPGWYTRLVHAKRGMIMSDTPAEMMDHLDAVRRATGRCLINGLGIGMVLGAILKKPDVERVTVVELEPDVIALVGPTYTKDRRVEVVQASAFDYQPPRGMRYNMVWHDIWDDITFGNLPAMERLHRKYARRADWQGSWCHGECQLLKRGWR